MFLRSFLKFSTSLSILLVLNACSTPSEPDGINDPYEKTNRQVHGFNKALDQNVFRTAGTVYGKVFSDTDDIIIDNFVTNLSLPRVAMNNLLQGDIEHFVKNSIGFALNTTLGFGGLNEVASEFGIEPDHADFGQTLYVWGVGEGRMIETPFFGARTGRGTIGLIVDFTIDPLSSVVPTSIAPALTGAKIIELAGDRHQYADLIDGVLYESDDSYATQRVVYLQNRRFFLKGAITEDDIEDPFADE